MGKKENWTLAGFLLMDSVYNTCLGALSQLNEVLPCLNEVF